MFKKTLLFSIVAIEIFALTCSPFCARAWSPADFVDPITKGIHNSIFGGAGSSNGSLINGMLQQGEERYHMDQETMQEYGENMNVSWNKGSAPEVMVTFSPSDPKMGEKITATALPMYFSTPSESLYYTWYLKHERCNLSAGVGPPSQHTLDSCDRDGDKRITVEDWKIEAMRIIANGGFKTEKVGKYADIAIEDGDNDGYKAHMGGDSNIRPATNYHCYIHDFKNGKNYELLSCDHLFPEAPGYETGANDKSFPKFEEKFWHTNPEDPDTADNGNKDEANIAGLGVNKFTWSYNSGDKVGVIVEGESMVPTKHNDSSMMIMWALPKNDCEVKDENKASYTKEIKGYDVTIPTAAVDINGCLERNLVDPREGGQPKNLEIALSYSPENPVNDPTEDNMGDRVSVQSIVSNASQSANQLYYEWEVKISRNGEFSLDDNDWRDITDDDNFFSTGKSISLTKGINISSLDFDLNFDQDNLVNNNANYLKNGIGYLKICLNVEENFEQGETRSGNSDVIIRFISSDKKIVPHKTTINDDGKLVMGSSICQDNLMEKSICFVVKNEIIGVDIATSNLGNYSWTFNGEPLICDSSISDDCRDDEQTGTNFFPVAGNPGDTYTLTVTANDTSPDIDDANLGNTIHLIKNFQIVEPSVKIVSAGENFDPKILGSYQDLDGNSFTDYSESVFQSPENSAVQLTAEFFPNFIGAEENFNGDNPTTKVQWMLGDVEESRGKNFEIAVNRPIGSIYNIGLNAIYEQPLAIRKALRDIWGISQFESTENRMSNFVQMEVIESSAANQSALKGSQKALASLLSHFPEQAMFLLRILLTVLMIIFVSGAVLSISPRRQN
ncbi:hypothetical protein J7J13_01470 [bacterium]|nr:hypothetical protein [bacterium]